MKKGDRVRIYSPKFRRSRGEFTVLRVRDGAVYFAEQLPKTIRRKDQMVRVPKGLPFSDPNMPTISEIYGEIEI